jgi:hypothetical protein
MIGKTYLDRVATWQKFRKDLEASEDPIQDTISAYASLPLVSIHTDPWTRESWPNPWELIDENTYCDYCIILGICYTLQLTERFKDSKFEIHIAIDRSESKDYYLLFIDDIVIGYDEYDYIHKSKIPSHIRSQLIHSMPALN